MGINNKKFILLILGTLTACSSVKHVAVVDNKQSVYYGKKEKFKFVTVRQGQTVSEIAEENRVPMSEVKRLNSLTSYDNVKAGQVIKIPVGHYYLVKESDTLENIARIHDVDLEYLAIVNGISTKSEVNAGSYIKIPKMQGGFTEPTQSQHIDFESSEIQDLDEEEEKIDVDSGKDSEVVAPVEPTSKAPKVEVHNKFFKNNTPANSKDFIWPVYGKIIKGYGDHNGKFNEGINIATNKGTAVKAAAKGQVIYVGKQPGYGNLIIIKHNNGYMTAYAHADKVLVKKGHIVNRGTQIGTVGDSGDVNQPQLQFSMKKGNRTINPDG